MHGDQPNRPVLEMSAELGRKPVPAGGLHLGLRLQDHRRQERANLRGDGPFRPRAHKPYTGDPTARRDPKGAIVDYILS